MNDRRFDKPKPSDLAESAHLPGRCEARHEAAALFRLLQNGEPLEGIRATIASSRDTPRDMVEYRARVSAHFDVLLLTSKTGRARGSRFSPDEREALARVTAASRSQSTRSIAQQFGLDPGTVAKLRRAAGDVADRRHLQKLSPAQIAAAARQLANGATWLETAAKFGVALGTLQRVIPPRKCTRQRLKPEILRAIAEGTQAGQQQIQIARATGVSLNTVRKYQRRAGVKIRTYVLAANLAKLEPVAPIRRTRQCFTPEERSRVSELIAAGKSQAQIARTTGFCHKTVRKFQKAAGVKTRTFLTPERRAQLEQGILAGRRTRDLVAEFRIDRTRVWQIAQQVRATA